MNATAAPRTIALLLLAAALCCGHAGAAEAKDVVVLTSGERVEGKITQENDLVVFLLVGEGEQRGISRTRIKEIIRGGANPQASVPKTDAPATGEGEKKEGAAGQALDPAPDPAPDLGAFPPVEEKSETQKLYDELKDLGHSQREKRAAAMARAKELGFRAVPVLLQVFHPKAKAPPELRLGALRALVELGPLDRQGAQTLGWVVMKDADFEVRREAAKAIRLLKDDRAIGYVLQWATNPDPRVQRQAAFALREINDDRAFATLANAIPPPEANATPPSEGDVKTREVMVPGPMGTKIPLTLVDRPVSGTVANTMSPPAEVLQMASGKKMGGLQGVWINWLNEKVGIWTKEERDEAFKNRSLMGRMGDPQARP